MITKELALIRTAFKEEDNLYRHRNVAKLLFMHMLGYPSHFGQMECLKLISSPKFPEKRIGYLALALLLTEDNEVLVLATNSIQSDLGHSNQFVVGLALNALGNICSADMARDLAPDVDKLLRSGNPFVRKKAALASIRVLKKVPELVEDFVDRANSLLNDRSHSVLLTGVTLITYLIAMEPPLVAVFKRSVPVLVRVLKNLVSNNYAPEHDVSGSIDPFLQGKIIYLLGLLGSNDPETSEAMNSVLAQVATNTESAKNAGNAILYECVNTIMNIEAEAGLRVLAINILGRFLLNRDNNIRFIALNTLIKVVNRDLASVQRHRNTVIDCLKDPDISIRKRAFELTVLLVNDSNVKLLVREMLNYLVVAEDEYRAELCTRIADVMSRYAPDKRWHLDTLITMLSIAGKQASNEITSAAITLIAQSPDLHSYMAHKLFQHLRDDLEQVALVHIAVWCVGEHGQLLLSPPPEDGPGSQATERDVINMLERIAKRHTATVLTKSLVLNALLKLTARFPTEAEQRRMEKLIGRYKTSMNLELQTRSCEFTVLLQPALDGIRPNILKLMPVPERSSAVRVKHSHAAGAEESDSGSDEEQMEVKRSENITGSLASVFTPAAIPAAAHSTGSDLLDLADIFGSPSLSTPSPVPASVSSAAAPSSNNSMDLLADIFGSGPTSASPAAPAASPLLGLGGFGGGLGAPSAQPASSSMNDLLGLLAPMPPPAAAMPPTAPAAAAGPAFPSIVAFQNNVLRVLFEFNKSSGDPSNTAVRATFQNGGAAPLTDLVFQAAVPKYLTLQLSPASGNVVPPGGSIQQQLRVANSMHGQKNLAMKLKIEYTLNGQRAQEMINVSNFPDSLWQQ